MPINVMYKLILCINQYNMYFYALYVILIQVHVCKITIQKLINKTIYGQIFNISIHYLIHFC